MVVNAYTVVRVLLFVVFFGLGSGQLVPDEWKWRVELSDLKNYGGTKFERQGLLISEFDLH